MKNNSNWVISPPSFVRKWFKGSLWRVETSEKMVFLTFDDGPIPGVTPWVLEQLDTHGFKATFFCVGDNVRKYPRIYNMLEKAKMGVGNHTFSHVPASRMSRSSYLLDIEKARDVGLHSHLFRPPHGLVWPWWMPFLKKHFAKVVMWDILSRDYDRALLPQQIIDGVLERIRPGSIIVFHDSIKAWPNLKIALPQVLKWLSENGYSSDVIP